MSDTVKTFPTGNILSITTGVMMSTPQKMSAIREVLEFMAGRPLDLSEFLPATHIYSREIMRQLPWVGEVGEPPKRLADPRGPGSGDLLDQWLEAVKAVHGSEHQLTAQPDLFPSFLEHGIVIIEI